MQRVKKCIFLVVIFFLLTVSTKIHVQADTLVQTQVSTLAITSNNSIINGNYFVGTQYSVSAEATSANKPLYRFWMGDLTLGKWTMLQDYSENNTIKWTPPYAGNFEISTHVRDSKSIALYESVKFSDIKVTKAISGKATVQSFNIVPSESYTIDSEGYYKGRIYTVSAKANSTNKALYRFWFGDLKSGKWTMLQDYSENSSINWKAPYVGNFELSVHVKDSSSDLPYDSVKFNDFTVKNTFSTVNTFSVQASTAYTNDPAGFYVGRTFKISAGANSTTKPLYRFWMGDLNTGKWTMLQNYSENSNINWIAPYSGKFELSVHVRDVNSSEPYESVKYNDFEVLKPLAKVQNLTIIPTGSYDIDPIGYYVGKKFTMTAIADSTNKTLYRFWQGDLTTGKWTMLKDYSQMNSINWSAPYAGNFELSVHVKDANSTEIYDSVKYSDFIVNNGTAKVNSFTVSPAVSPATTTNIDPNGFYKNRIYNLTASASATVKPLYRFWLGDLKAGKWTMLQDYSENSNINWTAPYAGNFELSVHIKDKFSSAQYDSVKYQDFSVRNWTSSIEKYSYSVTNYNFTINSMVNYQLRSGSPVYEGIPIGWYPASPALVSYYGNPINLVNDNYQQYQFLILNYIDGISVEDLNKLLQDKGILRGTGAAFLSASKTNNINVIYLVSHALLETGNGTSNLATGIVVNGQKVYNLFGIGAYDSDPDGYGSKYAFSQGWFSVDQAIKGGATFVSRSYINNVWYKQNTLYKMRWNPNSFGSSSPHQYATDVRWAFNQVYNIKRLLDGCPNAKLVFDVPSYSN